MNELLTYSIDELAKLYRGGKLAVREVVEAYLARIEAKEPSIGAFLRVARSEALDRAAKLDGRGYDGGALYGVPVAVKDNICTRGTPTTCASKILEGYRPPYDATVVERLERAGAVVVGKTNLDEFAMGSSCENSAFQPTRNPWDTGRAPGGSSGGSAAAVAARMAVASLGSDTGGSIRQPAALCGVTGLKGTYGRVSRFGLVAFASSLDQIGPLTRTVGDCARVMEAIAGHDERDATTIPEPSPTLTADLEKGLGGLRVAVPAGIESWDMDASVRAVVSETISSLAADGMQTHPVNVPGMETSIASYYILANAEASSNLARYDGVKYGFRAEGGSLGEMYERTRGRGFGEEVKRRILLGTYVLSSGYYDAYYAKAQQVKALICDQFKEIFRRYDLLMLPTSPTPAFRLGERLADPITMYLSDIFTTPANIAGLPAISIPAALSPEGLPIGMQLVAGWGKESVLLRGARGLEARYRFHERFAPPEEGGGGRG